MCMAGQRDIARRHGGDGGAVRGDADTRLECSVGEGLVDSGAWYPVRAGKRKRESQGRGWAEGKLQVSS